VVVLNINKAVFRENFIQTLNEIEAAHNIKIDDRSRFVVVPIFEKGKKLNSTDDNLQRWMLNDKNLSNLDLDFKMAADMLGCQVPYCPIWINVALKEIKSGIPIIELQISLRFRKPSLLHNKDTGHPPFRAIIPLLNMQ
jgi:hypothetical protein